MVRKYVATLNLAYCLDNPPPPPPTPQCMLLYEVSYNYTPHMTTEKEVYSYFLANSVCLKIPSLQSCTVKNIVCKLPELLLEMFKVKLSQHFIKVYCIIKLLISH